MIFFTDLRRDDLFPQHMWCQLHFVAVCVICIFIARHIREYSSTEQRVIRGFDVRLLRINECTIVHEALFIPVDLFSRFRVQYQCRCVAALDLATLHAQYSCLELALDALV